MIKQATIYRIGPNWAGDISAIEQALATAQFVPCGATQPAQAAQSGCTRSHPHEDMSPMCELKTQIAKLTNENTRLKAQAAQSNMQPAAPEPTAAEDRLRKDFARECIDTDTLLRLLDFKPDDVRTYGGSLNLPRLASLIEARKRQPAVAQGAGEVVAWLVSLENEPELGEWFAEEDISAQGYISKPLYTTPPAQPAPVVPEPKWIVNDLGELGVKVGDRFFFLYKGENIEYGVDGIGEARNGVAFHSDGTPMQYRIVGKREFGETCWPLKWITAGRSEDRYTENLLFTPGLSNGRLEDGEWRDLPAATPTPPAQAAADARDAWIPAAERKPLEADGEVFVRFADGSIGTAWATYWHGASNEFAQWMHPDPDEDRDITHWMKPAPLRALATHQQGGSK